MANPRYYGSRDPFDHLSSRMSQVGSSAGDLAAASRRQQMAMHEAMMQEQRYNTMRTEHLEADVVAQEEKEEEENIYYLLSSKTK